MVDELRHFLWVIETGTLTQASRKAHLSQPALTASLQRLEAYFGARLLERGPGGVRLTAAGEALLPMARAAVASVDDGRRAVSEVMGLRRGEVRVGAGATVCTYILPAVLARFRREHGGVRIFLRELVTDEVMGELSAGRLDLGVVVSDTVGEALPDDELVLVAAPGVDAAEAPFVSFGKGSTTRELLERHFVGAVVVMELGSIAAVKGNVRAGIGKALVSMSAVEVDVALGRLVVVPDPRTPIRRPLRLVHRGLSRLSPAAARLRELIIEGAMLGAGPASALAPRARRGR